MKLLKPKFWEDNKISFYSIILFPISILIQLINLTKYLLIRSKEFPITVICVGNIYLGGTGKTPLCLEIFRILKKLNKNPAFIRKKYKSFIDEINLLKTIGPIYENTKRIKAINEAIKNKFDIAILDDGFQDFSVKKNLSIVCFNEKQWIGNGYTIPAGPLREKLSALNRAHCVMINGEKNIAIENEILKKNKLIKIFYCKFVPVNISEFKGQRVVCFAGIGNPNNFFEIVKNNETNVIDQISFPDHYNYSKKELDNLIKKAVNTNSILLTTEKDYLRIDQKYRKNINYIKVNLKIDKENEFLNEIKKII